MDAIGDAESVGITVTAANYGQDGEVLRLKEGNAETLTFSDLAIPVTFGTVLLGIKDYSGKSLLRIAGTVSDEGATLTFNISGQNALKLREGVHKYDIYELDGYNATTGAFTASRFVLGDDVEVDGSNLRLETTNG